jgi:hypothetical protein
MATATPADPLAVRLTGYIPYKPHPRQHAFLWLDCQEALYGGAAGGGKSDALLMAALQYVDVPGYSAILFRRVYPDLKQAEGLIPRSKEWMSNTDARWNENDHRWTFPSGATLTFAHLQYEDSKYHYQGAAFQFIGFDELTQFTDSQYRYLFSRLRRPKITDDLPPAVRRRREALGRVPLRMRGASNPGGAGHRWVKHRLILKETDPDDPEDTVERAQERIFIPAKLQDNPSLDRAEYERSLANLDRQTREQLLNGDWDARPPGDWVFPKYLTEVEQLGRHYDELRAQDKMAPPVGGALVLSADWGVYSHVLLLWPLERDGWYVVKEIPYHGNEVIKELPAKVAEQISALGFPVHEERFDASAPQINAAFLEQLRKLVGSRIKHLAVPFGKYKALAITHLAGLVDNTGRHMNGEKGQLGPYLAVSPTGCPVLCEQLRGWIYSDPLTNRTEKGDDHGPDALVAGDAPVAAKRQRKT